MSGSVDWNLCCIGIQAPSYLDGINTCFGVNFIKHGIVNTHLGLYAIFGVN